MQSADAVIDSFEQIADPPLDRDVAKTDAHQVRKSAEEFLQRNGLRCLIFGGNWPFLTETPQHDCGRDTSHPAHVPQLIDVEVNPAIKNLNSFTELFCRSEKISIES